MPRAKTPRFENIRELLKDLGDIPAERVRYDPFPGTATKRDLLRVHGRNKLYELVEGALVEKPMGSPESFLAWHLGGLFWDYLRQNDIGYMHAPDVLVEVMPRLVRAPDLCFVSWAKRPDRTVSQKPISDLVPELVIEILSRGNTRAEMARKLKEYFLGGVEVVWFIDPRKKTAAVYTAPDAKRDIPADGALDGGDVLPGFSLPLAKLFERLEKPAPKKKKKA